MPFDNEKVLFDFVKSRLQVGDMIVIDKVLDECKYVSRKMILNKLVFLEDKQFLRSSGIPFKTVSLLAPSPAKFLRMVDNQFAISAEKANLSDAQYEVQKNRYLLSADIKQIILCLNLMDNHENVVLVTEESRTSNDSKLFKKIPLICDILGIQSMTLPALLSSSSDIEIKCCKRGG